MLKKCRAKDFALYIEGERRSETKMKMEQKRASDSSWKVISIVLVPPLLLTWRWLVGPKTVFFFAEAAGSNHTQSVQSWNKAFN